MPRHHISGTLSKSSTIHLTYFKAKSTRVSSVNKLVISWETLECYPTPVPVLFHHFWFPTASWKGKTLTLSRWSRHTTLLFIFEVLAFSISLTTQGNRLLAEITKFFKTLSKMTYINTPNLFVCYRLFMWPSIFHVWVDLNSVFIFIRDEIFTRG